MPKRKLTLAEKLFRISAEAPIIPRNGVGDDGQKTFTYAKAEDVFAAVNPLLRKHKLLVTGQTGKDVPLIHTLRGNDYSSEIIVEWTIYDLEWEIETEMALTYKIPGACLNGHGVAESLTASRKAFYIMVFNLLVADEPELQAKEKKEPDVKARPGRDNSETVSAS